jgi:hypothetical protein
MKKRNVTIVCMALLGGLSSACSTVATPESNDQEIGLLMARDDNVAISKKLQLESLLQEYSQDKITPAEYQARRAEIMKQTPEEALDAKVPVSVVMEQTPAEPAKKNASAARYKSDVRARGSSSSIPMSYDNSGRNLNRFYVGFHFSATSIADRDIPTIGTTIKGSSFSPGAEIGYGRELHSVEFNDKVRMNLGAEIALNYVANDVDVSVSTMGSDTMLLNEFGGRLGPTLDFEFLEKFIVGISGGLAIKYDWFNYEYRDNKIGKTYDISTDDCIVGGYVGARVAYKFSPNWDFFVSVHQYLMSDFDDVPFMGQSYAPEFESNPLHVTCGVGYSF